MDHGAAVSRLGTLRSGRLLWAGLALAALLAAACSSAETAAPASIATGRPLAIGAIPDQDPEKLQRLYGAVSSHLEGQLDVAVTYVPVTDYAAAVGLFRAGDLDLVWFGGLTGVQARLQVKGARAIVQRDIDESFHSVFIVHRSAGLAPVPALAGLAALKGRRFTFGSESSTSGRVMPQWFLGQAGVRPEDFAGTPGFSGSHDKTIELVESGTYEAGVLNEQVWEQRSEGGEVDLDRVGVFFRTPAYHDYHWVVRPDLADRFGPRIVERITAALIGLDPSDPGQKQILDLFGAGRFITTDDGNYRQIEEVGRQIGLIR